LNRVARLNRAPGLVCSSRSEVDAAWLHLRAGHGTLTRPRVNTERPQLGQASLKLWITA
jgi:hypothetical protein